MKGLISITTKDIYGNYQEYSFDIGDLTFNFFTDRDAILDSVNSNTYNHNHEYCELFYVSKGEMEIESEGVVYHINANDVVLIPQQTTHKSNISDNSQRIAIAFLFSKNANKSTQSYFNEFKPLTEKGILVFKNFPGTDAFRRFARYYSGNFKEKHHLVLSSLYEIISLAKEYLKEDDTYVNAFTDSGLYRNYVIEVYLDTKFADSSLLELSRLLNLSERQTHRIIKSIYGKPFKECIVEAKIKKSVQLIENTDFSLSEISELIGYKNQNSFFTAFKKYYGVTPRKYLKTNPRVTL